MARTRTTPLVVACLGDSLTYGAQTPEILHPWTDQLASDSRIFPRITTANFGKNGDVISGFKTRYELAIKDQGYSAVHLLAPVNDVQLQTPAATIWLNLEALVDEILGDGLPVILGVTSPAGGFATWNPTKQAILLAVRDMMLAKTGVTHADYYSLMDDPDNTGFLRPDLAYSDQLHWGPKAEVVAVEYLAPIVAALLPDTSAAAPGPVSAWG